MKPTEKRDAVSRATARHSINDCYAVAASQCGKHGFFDASDFLYGCANKDRPGENYEKRTFPIPANCTQCGHQGDIFIEDESLHKAMEDFKKSRLLAVWAQIAVPRMVASWLALFALGLAIGFWAGR
jgi:hypothetical protein